MVMTTCLIVYAALEHTIREQLKAQDEYFPDMKKKPTQTLLLNIKDRQAIIIKILGINYQQIYS